MYLKENNNLTFFDEKISKNKTVEEIEHPFGSVSLITPITASLASLISFTLAQPFDVIKTTMLMSSDRKNKNK